MGEFYCEVLMNDFVEPIEKPDLQMYLADFKEEVRRIDALVFAVRGRECAPVCVLDEGSAVFESAIRVGVVASFFEHNPLSALATENIAVLPAKSGHYVLWRRGIIRSIDTIFRHGTADAGLRRLWFQSATMLVRARVLCHQNFFRGVRIRTHASMRPHAALFGETVFSELPKLPALMHAQKCTDAEMDLRLTQVLIDAGLQRGMQESEALQFLISG
jgi:hypothetical protein